MIDNRHGESSGTFEERESPPIIPPALSLSAKKEGPVVPEVTVESAVPLEAVSSYQPELRIAHQFAPFSRHFERRPEPLFGRIVEVTDCSTSVRDRAASDLRVVRISDFLAGNDHVFLGFGLPNAYLAFPAPPASNEPHYEKFAAKSLRRAPSVVEDTKGWVQAGIHFLMRDLPEEAKQAIRVAAADHHGKKYWTCVNANARVLEDAGFTSGGKPLRKIYFPVALLRTIEENGLFYRGQPVNVEVFRTSRTPVEDFGMAIVGAESKTLSRHSKRAIDKWLRGTKLKWLTTKRKLSQKGAVWEEREIAPSLPEGVKYKDDLDVRVSVPSQRGFLVRMLWGPHHLFEVRQNRVAVSDFLPDKLRAYPQEKPSLATRLKKGLLFSPPVIRGIRRELCPRYFELGERDEAKIHRMLLTDSEKNPNKFNLFVTGEKIILSRLKVRFPKADWIMSKHVLVSGYDSDVRFAGEVWKDKDGVINVNGNSGTYQPTDEQLLKLVEYLQRVFPSLTFKAERRTSLV
ncbi:MAG: hypothetical protein KDD64_02405 [Bdellovibrionales bacterium]|nr:hypothetical protein [Bdellovibrionales bacterium]